MALPIYEVNSQWEAITCSPKWQTGYLQHSKRICKIVKVYILFKQRWDQTHTRKQLQSYRKDAKSVFSCRSGWLMFSSFMTKDQAEYKEWLRPDISAFHLVVVGFACTLNKHFRTPDTSHKNRLIYAPPAFYESWLESGRDKEAFPRFVLQAGWEAASDRPETCSSNRWSWFCSFGCTRWTWGVWESEAGDIVDFSKWPSWAGFTW